MHDNLSVQNKRNKAVIALCTCDGL